ncbi:ATP-grasp domain-containing protein [Fictibacillus enclensis]|uniref:ATP-grasp domain-containing protein n=1 Tax=Fictibacillus enclensis TaxID=1017270 RepID=UPI0024BF5AD6|nr:ATP-grasp domain-containing protein [Fictibacillus enclensis]WHY75027.1 ATP-grasp domain-containing protein [Fictibacillus enclensis]
MNILFTSSGRRVSLIQKFKDVMSKNNIKGKIISADLKGNAPTAYISDKHYLVPKVTDKNYLQELLSICVLNEIDLVIPLIDTELNLIAKNKLVFNEHGINVLVSSERINEIANDKLKTFEFFQRNSIPTPKVYSEQELEEKKFSFPLIVKPRNGSSSQGVTIINNEKELYFFKEYIPNAIVQEYIQGKEYTVDVMLDYEGNIKTIVPRLRIETRSGEVSKGTTKKDKRIINEVRKLLNVLPGSCGCITVQLFKKEDGEISIIEINPRFGGGIPLSIEAGANFPLWTIEMSKGVIFNVEDFTWKDGFSMLRFDEALYMESNIYENKYTSV